MTTALEGDEWSAARPGRTLPPGKSRYPFYRRLGGPQGRSGRAENLVPTGIRSRTVQPGSSVDIPTELSGPHINTHTLFYYERKVWQKQEMSLLLHYCNIKHIPYLSHSSLALSATKIKYSKWLHSQPHIRSFIKVEYYTYFVISLQVSTMRQRDFVLQLEALDLNSEARRNLICIQCLFHVFHKSHYIAVLLRGNSAFHYSM